MRDPQRPPERRHHLRRRSGVRATWAASAPRDTTRPTSTGWRAEGRTLHRLLRGAGRLLGLAGGPADRLLFQPRGHPRRARPEVEDRHQRRGTRSPRSSSRSATPRRSTASGTWATRRSSCPPATGSTTTSACPTPTTCGRSTRPAQFVPRPAAVRRGVGHRDQPRPAQPHHLVHRARRPIHREEQGSALLPVRPAQHAARPAVRLRQVRRQDRSRACSAT